MSSPAPIGSRVAVGACALALAVVAGAALLPAFTALLGPADVGGVDLWHRAAEVGELWSGRSPYGRSNATGGNAVYPPASYVLLGPLLWFDDRALVWAWALGNGALLAGLGAVAVRVSGARRPELALLVALLPASIAGVAYGIQNGQVHVLVMAALVGAAGLLLRGDTTRRGDLLGGLLLLVALIKPTVAGPFLGLLLARRDRWGVLAGVVLGYCALTAVGLALAGQGGELLWQWMARAQGGASYGAGGSYGNLHAWSPGLGLDGQDSLLTAGALLGLLGWVLSGRAAAQGALGWCGFGVVCVVARVAVYHQDYDDTLLIGLQLGLLALARRDRAALPVLAALVLVMLPPRELLDLGGGVSVLEAARLAVWSVGAAVCVRAVRAGYGPGAEAGQG